jgi:hypothetical protein
MRAHMQWEHIHMPLDHNMNQNGKRGYLLGHTNTSTPSNVMQGQIYFPQLFNTQVHPPLTYNDGRDGEDTARMQTLGYDQSCPTMQLNSTAGLNALEDIGESHNTTMASESTTFADNQVHGNYIPHYTTMDVENRIIANNQVRDGGGSLNSYQSTMKGNAAGSTTMDRDNSSKATIVIGNKIFVGNHTYEEHHNYGITRKGKATKNTPEAIGNSRNTIIAKQRTIPVKDKEHGNYNSGMRIVKDDLGGYHNRPQRTLIDVTAENSIKGSNNPQSAAGTQDYDNSKPETTITEDDFILSVCTSVLYENITKIQRMDKKEKREIRQAQKATPSGTHHVQHGTTKQGEQLNQVTTEQEERLDGAKGKKQAKKERRFQRRLERNTRQNPAKKKVKESTGSDEEKEYDLAKKKLQSKAADPAVEPQNTVKPKETMGIDKEKNTVFTKKKM